MTDISKPVQRYSSSRNASGLGFSNGIVLDGEGDFVAYSDYAALQARVSELEDVLERIGSASQFYSQPGTEGHAARYAHESNCRLVSEIMKGAGK